MFNNPILPGFHPDPSIVKEGKWAYIVCSTFSWMPGLPVYRSDDLRHWEPLPPVIDKEGIVDFCNCDCDDGLYAPAIRYKDPLFYVTCTLVQRRTQRFRNFICTSQDPTQGWSDPVWLPEDLGRIDPTPFWDHDGQMYLVLNCLPTVEWNHNANREIRLWKLDNDSFQPIGDPVPLWHGALVGSQVPEGPRIFSHSGYYYLFIAAGGFDNHSVEVARSKSITGPYTAFMGNPIFTHRHLGLDYPIQGVGHADLINWDGDTWYATVLAGRMVDREMPIGRETWLVPVTWKEGEWPVFAPGEGKISSVPTPGKGPDSGFLCLRKHPKEISTINAKGEVVLTGSSAHWDDPNTAPSMIGRRIIAITGSWCVTLESNTTIDDCGIGLYYSHESWIRLKYSGGFCVLEDGSGVIHYKTKVRENVNRATFTLKWDPRGFLAELTTSDSFAKTTVPVRHIAKIKFAGAVACVFAQRNGVSLSAKIQSESIIGVSGYPAG
jgi:hypothetical protein